MLETAKSSAVTNNLEHAENVTNIHSNAQQHVATATSKKPAINLIRRRKHVQKRSENNLEFSSRSSGGAGNIFKGTHAAVHAGGMRKHQSMDALIGADQNNDVI